MGVPQGVPNEALRYKKQNVRRHRHVRGTSTPRAHSNSIHRKSFKMRYTWAYTAALPYVEFVNTSKTKAIQPASQREAGWNVEWACLKGYPRKHYDTRRQNVRRHRHDCGTSTLRAHSNSIHRKSFKMRYHRQTRRSAPMRSSST
jgi:hypothetical protein